MNVKLISVVLVAVVLGASSGSIIAATHANIVYGATGEAAQTAPHFSQLSQEFINFQQALSSGNARAANAQFGIGFIPPPVNLSRLAGQSIGSALVSAPSYYDLRTQNKLTPVKDQGDCSACWAFAAYASLESFLRPAETRDFSENNMKNTNGFDAGPGGGGNEFMATAYLARWAGPINASDDPYIANSTSSPPKLPVQKHVQDVMFIPDRTRSSDNNNIKTAVATYGAVYTEMYIQPPYPAQYNKATNAYYYRKAVQANHAVAIVGWDDNFSRKNFVRGNEPRGNGAFIVRNSWGTNWGEQGYFYVSYYDAVIGKDNAVFTAQPTTNYDNIYQYDPLGVTRAFGQKGSSEWGANVFTAKASENLTAVSFYTLSMNAPYEIYVYTDPSAGPINASGPVAHTSGSLALPGYHTVPLASGVSLRAGQRFSVVVKFTATRSTTPVPTEAPLKGYSSQARANAGESYYHSDNRSWSEGSTWADMTSYSANTIICIKAFTKSPGPQPTQLSLSVSATAPTVRQTVTFTASLTSGTKPLSAKPVTIYHYSNGVRYDVTNKNTDANGQVTATASFGDAGPRTYYATFGGDSAYQAATSSVLTVNAS